MKNCILSDHAQNHSFWGCDWWFRKMNGRHRAILEKIDLDRFESFEIVSGCLGHFRPFLHCLGIFRSFQVLEKENLSLFPEK
jgi:hypothetical protein